MQAKDEINELLGKASVYLEAQAQMRGRMNAVDDKALVAFNSIMGIAGNLVTAILEGEVNGQTLLTIENQLLEGPIYTLADGRAMLRIASKAA